MLPCRLSSSEKPPFRSVYIDSARQCIHLSCLYLHRSLCKIGLSLSSNIIIVFLQPLDRGIHNADTAYTIALEQHESHDRHYTMPGHIEVDHYAVDRAFLDAC